jgi:hypothetical protein
LAESEKLLRLLDRLESHRVTFGYPLAGEKSHRRSRVRNRMPVEPVIQPNEKRTAFTN